MSWRVLAWVQALNNLADLADAKERDMLAGAEMAAASLAERGSRLTERALYSARVYATLSRLIIRARNALVAIERLARGT